MDIVTLPAARALHRAGLQDGAAGLPVTALDGVVVLQVSGEIDLYTGPALKDALQELLSPTAVVPPFRRGAGLGESAGSSGGPSPDRVRAVVLDLSDVAFVDSFALGVLVHGHRLARPGGQSYAVVATHEMIHMLFRVTGLARVLPLQPDLVTALRTLRPASGTVSA